MERCTITMKVDTVNINTTNVSQYVKLEDSFGGQPNGSPEDFTSNISIGNEVCWDAIPKDHHTGDMVVIDKVTYEADVDILGETEILPDAQGQVLRNAVNGTIGDEEKYGIYFTVTRNSQTPEQLFLDPKLKIHNTNP